MAKPKVATVLPNAEQVNSIRRIFESSMVATSLTSLTGRPVYVNDALVKFFNATPEAVAATVSVLDITHPDDIAATEEMMARLRTGEIENARIHKRLVAMDGAVKWGELSLTLLRDEANQPYAWLTLIVDNTDRMLVEEQLRTANVAAEAAVRAKSEFLSRVSHELRTPLTAILGYADLLKLDESDPERAESVDTILRAGLHLLHLVDDLLDFDRSADLGITLVPTPVDKLIREAMELVGPEASKAGVRVERRSERFDEKALGDARRLKQILVNLLINAIKYNAPGCLVTVDTVRIADRLRISVHDSGAGIAPEDIDKLFIPFERLKASRAEVPGVGLGLALSRALAEAMGGSMDATSSDAGTTFWVEIAAAP